MKGGSSVMKKWEVLSNYVGGETVYQVARIRNEQEVRHAGNFDFDGVFDTEKEAQAHADELNVKDKLNEIRQALTSLGYATDKALFIAVELDDVRAQVHMDGGVVGIYDFIKHTFVD